MQNIDFLPSRYHEQDAARRAFAWRCLLLLSFGLVVCLAATGQYLYYRAAKRSLDAVQPQHADALAKAAELAQLQSEIAASREFAQLYTYLQHPWPRTQLLAEVARDLPGAVTLTELTIVDENVSQPSFVAAGGQPETDAVAGAARDLTTLRSGTDDARTAVQLSGVTTDAAALHLYVMALGQSSLFENAKLDSLEAMRGPGTAQGVARFLVRLTVRPGYSKPGGPSGPPDDVVAADVARDGSAS